MKRFLTVCLVCAALLPLTACSSTITVANYKSYFQLALNTFVAAMDITNPGWNGQKISADASAAIAAWNTGASWQTNAISELEVLQTDVGDIPNCSTNCKALTVVFLGAAATGTAIAEQSQPPQQQVAAMSAKVKKQASAAKGATYKTWKEYKASWNAAAPAGAKL